MSKRRIAVKEQDPLPILLLNASVTNKHHQQRASPQTPLRRRSFPPVPCHHYRRNRSIALDAPAEDLHNFHDRGPPGCWRCSHFHRVHESPSVASMAVTTAVITATSADATSMTSTAGRFVVSEITSATSVVSMFVCGPLGRRCHGVTSEYDGIGKVGAHLQDSHCLEGEGGRGQRFGEEWIWQQSNDNDVAQKAISNSHSWRSYGRSHSGR